MRCDIESNVGLLDSVSNFPLFPPAALLELGRQMAEIEKCRLVMGYELVQNQTWKKRRIGKLWWSCVLCPLSEASWTIIVWVISFEEEWLSAVGPVWLIDWLIGASRLDFQSYFFWSSFVTLASCVCSGSLVGMTCSLSSNWRKWHSGLTTQTITAVYILFKPTTKASLLPEVFNHSPPLHKALISPFSDSLKLIFLSTTLRKVCAYVYHVHHSLLYYYIPISLMPELVVVKRVYAIRNNIYILQPAAKAPRS